MSTFMGLFHKAVCGGGTGVGVRATSIVNQGYPVCVLPG